MVCIYAAGTLPDNAGYISMASEGQQKGEIRTDMVANEIVKMYALCERALMYDWCLCNGEYSLKRYAADLMPMFLYKLCL